MNLNLKQKYNEDINKLKHDNLTLINNENIYKNTLKKLNNVQLNNNNNFLNNSFYSYVPSRNNKFLLNNTYNTNNNINFKTNLDYSFHLLQNLKNSLNKIDFPFKKNTK